MEIRRILNTDSAIDMLDHDKDLYTDLLNSYIKDAPFDPEKLRQLLRDNNIEEAARYVHKIKGASAQLGAEQLADAGQALEHVLRGFGKGDIPSLAEKLITSYTETMAAIAEYCTHS